MRSYAKLCKMTQIDATAASKFLQASLTTQTDILILLNDKTNFLKQDYFMHKSLASFLYGKKLKYTPNIPI